MLCIQECLNGDSSFLIGVEVPGFNGEVKYMPDGEEYAAELAHISLRGSSAANIVCGIPAENLILPVRANKQSGSWGTLHVLTQSKKTPGTEKVWDTLTHN
jgi:hypothetical protein